MTPSFVVIPVCLAATPREDCGETTAVEVRTIRVGPKLHGALGRQDIIARAAERVDAPSGRVCPLDGHVPGVARIRRRPEALPGAGTEGSGEGRRGPSGLGLRLGERQARGGPAVGALRIPGHVDIAVIERALGRVP